MAKVELRDDGWFEAGKDSKDFSHIAYMEKQKLKKKLEDLNENNLDRDSLETAIKDIKGNRPAFKGKLYLRSNQILVETPGLPGECYLGQIVED